MENNTLSLDTNLTPKHGTTENAIKYLKAELESFHSLTSEFSYDCVYHGITCNKLIISYLKKNISNENSNATTIGAHRSDNKQ